MIRLMAVQQRTGRSEIAAEVRTFEILEADEVV